jgi:hypothetical protein
MKRTSPPSPVDLFRGLKNLPWVEPVGYLALVAAGGKFSAGRQPVPYTGGAILPEDAPEFLTPEPGWEPARYRPEAFIEVRPERSRRVIQRRRPILGARRARGHAARLRSNTRTAGSRRSRAGPDDPDLADADGERRRPEGVAV